MDPNQQPMPQPAPPPGHFNSQQYDFITSPAARPKRSLIPGAGSSKNQRIIVAVIGVLGLLTFGLLIYGLLTSGPDNKDQLIGVAQTQVELIHISETATDKATNPDTKNLAKSIGLVMQSDESNLSAALSKNGVKLKDRDLEHNVDASIDQKLATAETNGTFDASYNALVKDLLSSYQTSVKTAFDGTSSKLTKEALSTAYDNASLLLTQANTK
jgi:hypothetical protein